jgi:hypothetical protein
MYIYRSHSAWDGVAFRLPNDAKEETVEPDVDLEIVLPAMMTDVIPENPCA